MCLYIPTEELAGGILNREELVLVANIHKVWKTHVIKGSGWIHLESVARDAVGCQSVFMEECGHLFH